MIVALMSSHSKLHVSYIVCPSTLRSSASTKIFLPSFFAIHASQIAVSSNGSMISEDHLFF